MPLNTPGRRAESHSAGRLTPDAANDTNAAQNGAAGPATALLDPALAAFGLTQDGAHLRAVGSTALAPSHTTYATTPQEAAKRLLGPTRVSAPQQLSRGRRVNPTATSLLIPGAGFGAAATVRRKSGRESSILDMMAVLRDYDPDASFAVWNWIRIGNPGHDVMVKNPDGTVNSAALDYINGDLAKRIWRDGGGGADTLVNAMHLAILTYGGVGAEAVPNDSLTDIVDVWPFGPGDIEFRLVKDPNIDSKDTATHAMYPSRRGFRVASEPLNPLQTFYLPLDPDIDDPYGRPPLLPSIQALVSIAALLNEVQQVAHIHGYGMRDVTVNTEAIAKLAPPMYKASGAEDYMYRFIGDTLTAIREEVSELSPTDTFVHFENVEIQMTQAGAVGMGLDPVFNELGRRATTALKTLPMLLGNIEDAGAMATVGWSVFVSGIEAVQALSKRLLENIYNLAIRIKGFTGQVTVTFHEIRKTDRAVEASAYAVEISNEEKLYQMGVNSHQRMSRNLTKHDPEGPPPPTDGTIKAAQNGILGPGGPVMGQPGNPGQPPIAGGDAGISAEEGAALDTLGQGGGNIGQAVTAASQNRGVRGRRDAADLSGQIETFRRGLVRGIQDNMASRELRDQIDQVSSFCVYQIEAALENGSLPVAAHDAIANEAFDHFNLPPRSKATDWRAIYEAIRSYMINEHGSRHGYGRSVRVVPPDMRREVEKAVFDTIEYGFTANQSGEDLRTFITGVSDYAFDKTYGTVERLARNMYGYVRQYLRSTSDEVAKIVRDPSNEDFVMRICNGAAAEYLPMFNKWRAQVGKSTSEGYNDNAGHEHWDTRPGRSVGRRGPNEFPQYFSDAEWHQIEDWVRHNYDRYVREQQVYGGEGISLQSHTMMAADLVHELHIEGSRQYQAVWLYIRDFDRQMAGSRSVRFPFRPHPEAHIQNPDERPSDEAEAIAKAQKYEAAIRQNLYHGFDDMNTKGGQGDRFGLTGESCWNEESIEWNWRVVVSEFGLWRFSDEVKRDAPGLGRLLTRWSFEVANQWCRDHAKADNRNIGARSGLSDVERLLGPNPKLNIYTVERWIYDNIGDYASPHDGWHGEMVNAIIKEFNLQARQNVLWYPLYSWVQDIAEKEYRGQYPGSPDPDVSIDDYYADNRTIGNRALSADFLSYLRRAVAREPMVTDKLRRSVYDIGQFVEGRLGDEIDAGSPMMMHEQIADEVRQQWQLNDTDWRTVYWAISNFLADEYGTQYPGTGSSRGVRDAATLRYFFTAWDKIEEPSQRLVNSVDQVVAWIDRAKDVIPDAYYQRTSGYYGVHEEIAQQAAEALGLSYEDEQILFRYVEKMARKWWGSAYPPDHQQRSVRYTAPLTPEEESRARDWIEANIDDYVSRYKPAEWHPNMTYDCMKEALGVDYGQLSSADPGGRKFAAVWGLIYDVAREKYGTTQPKNSSQWKNIKKGMGRAVGELPSYEEWLRQNARRIRSTIQERVNYMVRDYQGGQGWSEDPADFEQSIKMRLRDTMGNEIFRDYLHDVGLGDYMGPDPKKGILGLGHPPYPDPSSGNALLWNWISEIFLATVGRQHVAQAPHGHQQNTAGQRAPLTDPLWGRVDDWIEAHIDEYATRSIKIGWHVQMAHDLMDELGLGAQYEAEVWGMIREAAARHGYRPVDGYTASRTATNEDYNNVLHFFKNYLADSIHEAGAKLDDTGIVERYKHFAFNAAGRQGWWDDILNHTETDSEIDQLLEDAWKEAKAEFGVRRAAIPLTGKRDAVTELRYEMSRVQVSQEMKDNVEKIGNYINATIEDFARNYAIEHGGKGYGWHDDMATEVSMIYDTIGTTDLKVLSMTIRHESMRRWNTLYPFNEGGRSIVGERDAGSEMQFYMTKYQASSSLKEQWRDVANYIDSMIDDFAREFTISKQAKGYGWHDAFADEIMADFDLDGLADYKIIFQTVHTMSVRKYGVEYPYENGQRRKRSAEATGKRVGLVDDYLRILNAVHAILVDEGYEAPPDWVRREVYNRAEGLVNDLLHHMDHDKLDNLIQSAIVDAKSYKRTPPSGYRTPSVEDMERGEGE